MLLLLSHGIYFANIATMLGGFKSEVQRRYDESVAGS